MWIHPKIKALTSPDGQAFMEMLRVASTIPTTDCWRWPGRINADGYGIILLDFQPFLIHRVSFELYKGYIPKQFSVMHDCDFRRCWKPGHLFLGTPADNVHDMIHKHRAGWQRKEREDRNKQRCKEIAQMHPAYGRDGEVREFRCVMPLGHEGEHWYDLCVSPRPYMRPYGPLEKPRPINQLTRGK